MSVGAERLNQALEARRRAALVGGLRDLARGRTTTSPDGRPGEAAPGGSPAQNGSPQPELCDLCGTTIAEDHRHLLHLSERRIACACEPCIALRAAEEDYRPTGTRTVWLGDELELPDDLWASFGIPIGLAFFMESSVTACVVAMYPSPGGATESELRFDAWSRMLTLNPVLRSLEADIEGLLVNRLDDPPRYAIAPIDRCYELTGLVKAKWEGLSGGAAVRDAVGEYFARLEARAAGR